MTINQINEFVEYVLSFYGSDPKHDRIYNIGTVTRADILEALILRLNGDGINEHGKEYKAIPFDGDSFDREYVRDIIIANR